TDGHDCSRRYGRVRAEMVLEFGGCNPFSAGLDQILLSVTKGKRAVGVDRGNVSRGEPAFVPFATPNDERPSDLEPSGNCIVGGTLVVLKLQFDEGNWLPRT